MANVFEYLDWRGDVPFSVDPFNSVDNLIFSWIAYTDFEGILSEGEGVFIEDAAKKYFELHTEEEVMARNTFFKTAAFVLRRAASVERFKNVLLENYVNVIDADRDEQCSAVTFRFPDGMRYAAFRGTDNTLVGWREDFNLTFMEETAGQRRAVEYVNKYLKGTDELILGGHSKGGNLAVYAGAFCDKNIQDRIKTVYSNDGPGFRQEVLDKQGYKDILPRIVSIIPEDSIVGMLLSNEYNNRIIKSSAKLVAQHDPMTWLVYGRDFVCADKISQNSRFIDKTMVKWLSTMSDEDRRSFTDSLFSSLDSTGVTTLGEISEGGVKIISEAIKSFKSMDPEKQKEFSELVKRLIKIGNEIILNNVKGRIKPVTKIAMNPIYKITKAAEQIANKEQNAAEEAAEDTEKKAETEGLVETEPSKVEKEEGNEEKNS